LAEVSVGEQRVWTSADGREISATLLEIDSRDEAARLKREDGYTFTIAFDQFDPVDAALLREAATAMRSPERAPVSQTPDTTPDPVELPERFELDDVPMVKQKGNFCVPASATMIAGFHGIETDQDQIAFLSSAMSFNNEGTYPRDMLLAMEKLGFDGSPLYWKNAADFSSNALPAIREALVTRGPIYISFKPGVFGDSGHGCVIIGYHDRRELLIFHNPWGNVFEKDYADVAVQGRGIVIIDAPQAAPIAGENFIREMQQVVPAFEGDISKLTGALKRGNVPHELIWCSRSDAREDRRFAVDTARDDGRKILDLAFHRNPAVFIPKNDRKGTTESILFVTRPPEGGASFLVREISSAGWSEPELVTLGSLTRYWPTRIETNKADKIIWELPMIELHPAG